MDQGVSYNRLVWNLQCSMCSQFGTTVKMKYMTLYQTYCTLLLGGGGGGGGGGKGGGWREGDREDGGWGG